MSWLVIMAFALPIFFGLLLIMKKFVQHMKDEQNLEIESVRESLIDADNPVGLSGEELQQLKQQQAEAQKHLREVISRIPVDTRDGRFRPAFDKTKKPQGEESANGKGDGNGAGKETA